MKKAYNKTIDVVVYGQRLASGAWDVIARYAGNVMFWRDIQGRLAVESMKLGKRLHEEIAVSEDILKLPNEEMAIELRERVAEVVSEDITRGRWLEVAEIYQRRGFAVAKSTSEEMTAYVQKQLVKANQEGLTQAEFVNIMKEKADWTQGYSEMVYRTNSNTAFHAGRYKAAKEAGDVVGGFVFRSTPDGRTRPNHKAVNGLQQPVDSVYWDYYYPPLGYNCRCSVLMVPAYKFKAHVPAKVKLPPDDNAGPDNATFGSVRAMAY